MWSTLMYDFHVPTSSARSVNWALPDSHLWISLSSFRPSYLKKKGSQTFAQVSYFYGTMIVNLCEFSQPLTVTHSLLPSPKFVTMFCMKPSPSSCCFASNFNALIRFPLRPCGCACTLKTLAWKTLSPVCTTKSLVGCFQSYFSPQIAHHQFVCFLPETHQTWSSSGKLLQCGHKYDIATPPCPQLAR